MLGEEKWEKHKIVKIKMQLNTKHNFSIYAIPHEFSYQKHLYIFNSDTIQVYFPYYCIAHKDTNMQFVWFCE